MRNMKRLIVLAAKSGVRGAPAVACLIALGVALAAPAARADQDYPPGLFENSPVVPHGQQYQGPPDAGPPAGDMYPPDGSEPPMAGPPPGPMDPYAAEPPVAAPPIAGSSMDDCANMAFRVFNSLAEVRRAHARCDRFRGPPPQGPGPIYGQ